MNDASHRIDGSDEMWSLAVSFFWKFGKKLTIWQEMIFEGRYYTVQWNTEHGNCP